jgi:hypothetical protein
MPYFTRMPTSLCRLTVAMLAFASPVGAQDSAGIVTGTLWNQNDEVISLANGLAATVELKGAWGHREMDVNIHGAYRFTNVPPGPAVLSVTTDASDPDSALVVVPAHDSVILNMTLRVEPLVLAPDAMDPPVPTPITVSVSAGWTPKDQATEPLVGLHASTTQQFSTVCAQQAQRADTHGSIIVWHLYRPQQVGMCEDMFGPETFVHTFALTPGTYELRIESGPGTDVYRLAVAADHVVLTSRGHSQFSRPVADTLAWRTPERTFAVFCSPGRLREATCDTFRARLAAEPGVTVVPPTLALTAAYLDESRRSVVPTYYRYDFDGEEPRVDALVAAATGNCFDLEVIWWRGYVKGRAGRCL